MPMTFNAKTYSCECVEFEANDDGEVIVTLFGDFPAPEEMTVEEATSVVNDPQFIELLRLAYQNTALGTPLWSAFERLRHGGRTAVLRFEQPEARMAA
jgi:hypothetical protein